MASRTVPLAEIAAGPSEPTEDDVVRIIGWGTTSAGGRLATTLMQADVEVIPNNVCDNNYGNYPGSIVNSTMCAG